MKGSPRQKQSSFEAQRKLAEEGRRGAVMEDKQKRREAGGSYRLWVTGGDGRGRARAGGGGRGWAGAGEEAVLVGGCLVEGGGKGGWTFVSCLSFKGIKGRPCGLWFDSSSFFQISMKDRDLFLDRIPIILKCYSLSLWCV